MRRSAPFRKGPRLKEGLPDERQLCDNGVTVFRGRIVSESVQWPPGHLGAAMAAKAASIFDPQAFLATVGPGHTLSDLRKDEVVFRQSAAADAVFYIKKGKIKIVVASKEGKEAVVGVMSPGEFFGEGCLIGQALRLATAKAMVDSQVVRVS